MTTSNPSMTHGGAPPRKSQVAVRSPSSSRMSMTVRAIPVRASTRSNSSSRLGPGSAVPLLTVPAELAVLAELAELALPAVRTVLTGLTRSPHAGAGHRHVPVPHRPNAISASEPIMNRESAGMMISVRIRLILGLAFAAAVRARCPAVRRRSWA